MREVPQLKNKFDREEWSGSFGDLGTLLPLAFALIVFNGFAPERLFLLWGMVYILSGFIFKVPLSVQPLKAMSVIAIAHGFSPEFISSTSVFYGLFFILISTTGVLKSLEKWFSSALVSGIQLGIGLILAHKAIELAFQQGIALSEAPMNPWMSALFLLATFSLFLVIQQRKQAFLAVGIIIMGMIVLRTLGYEPISRDTGSNLLSFQLPQISFFIDALILLMIPQLPLTLGNAVFAASDVSHRLWDPQARRVNPTRLGLSIGISDTFIGLLGGFPVCHGSGGMAAHAQFGGRTGGSTMIMGSILVLLALIPSAASFVFFIPVPILASMLLLNSWRMISLQKSQLYQPEMITIAIVAITSLFTRNLTTALILGLLSEQLIKYFLSKTQDKGTTHD